MEFIMLLLVSYYLANNLITNTAYAVRGLDPPKHKERMARLEHGGQSPAGKYRSGRNGASRFFAELWHDAWDDAHAKRQELRERRQTRRTVRATVVPEPVEPAEPGTQPDGDIDTPGALRPQEHVEPGDNVISLATRGRRTPESTDTATATLSRPASITDRPLDPYATSRRPAASARRKEPASTDATDSAPARSGSNTDAAPPVVEPQPSGDVETPAALLPVQEADTASGDSDDGQRSTSGDQNYTYPSLFESRAEEEAHFLRLPRETQQVVRALNKRLAATPPGVIIPISIAEESAMLQSRGYPREVADQVAQQRLVTGRAPGMSRPENVPEADSDVPDHRPVVHERPAADGGGVAEPKESQEGTQMPTMTSNNAAGQPTGETAGLGSAIRFAEGMANSMRDAAARTETSVASLTGSEVGPGPTAALQQAMEAVQNAAAAFEHAKAELEKQLTVREAYDATPDAGNKQFLQND